MTPGQTVSNQPSPLTDSSVQAASQTFEKSWKREVLQGGVELIEQLATEWRDLCQEGEFDKPFYRPEWFRAYVRAFARDKQICLATLRDRGRLCAILPLVLEQVSMLGLRVTRLCGLANEHSPRFDMILGASVLAEESAPEIWKALKEYSRWDILQVPDVPIGGAFEEVLLAAERDGYQTGRWESIGTPFIVLPVGRNPRNATLGETDAKFRANLRRRKRKLAAQGALFLRRNEKADPADLKVFYDLELAGWKGRSGSAIACSPSTRQFYDDLACDAERFGYLSLYFLELDGRPVAAHYGLTHQGIYYCPKVVFDEAWHACSPGQLLVEEILQDCVARGLHEFDFVGPCMRWKAEWTSQVRRFEWCFVFSHSWKARVLHAAKFQIGPMMKEKLGLRNSAKERKDSTHLQDKV